jgi:hypothetical protein
MSVLRKRELLFHKIVPITKIDLSRREVSGVVTAEVPDKDNEVCDYASTKPEYQKWSLDISKASQGKNIGNLREMHQLSAVGVGKQLEFQDSLKQILMTFKVVDDMAWKKCEEGVYTGFSQGGAYVKQWKKDGMTHYTARPSEVSLVDNPCLPDATFTLIRADGSIELRKFTTADKIKEMFGQCPKCDKPMSQDELTKELICKHCAGVGPSPDSAVEKGGPGSGPHPGGHTSLTSGGAKHIGPVTRISEHPDAKGEGTWHMYRDKLPGRSTSEHYLHSSGAVESYRNGKLNYRGNFTNQKSDISTDLQKSDMEKGGPGSGPHPGAHQQLTGAGMKYSGETERTSSHPDAPGKGMWSRYEHPDNDTEVFVHSNGAVESFKDSNAYVNDKPSGRGNYNKKAFVPTDLQKSDDEKDDDKCPDCGAELEDGKCPECDALDKDDDGDDDEDDMEKGGPGSGRHFEGGSHYKELKDAGFEHQGSISGSNGSTNHTLSNGTHTVVINTAKDDDKTGRWSSTDHKTGKMNFGNGRATLNDHLNDVSRTSKIVTNDLQKSDDQYRAPSGQFSMTPEEISGEVTYHQNMANASVLAGDGVIAEAHEVMQHLWEARAEAAHHESVPQQISAIAYDPNEVDGILESVGIGKSMEDDMEKGGPGRGPQPGGGSSGGVVDRDLEDARHRGFVRYDHHAINWNSRPGEGKPLHEAIRNGEFKPVFWQHASNPNNPGIMGYADSKTLESGKDSQGHLVIPRDETKPDQSDHISGVKFHQLRGKATKSTDLEKVYDENLLADGQEECSSTTIAAHKAASIEEDSMSEGKADLEKAANVLAHVKKMHKAHNDFHQMQSDLHEGLGKLHKGAAMHHEKISKLHKARHVEATDHFQALHKMLGSEEAGKFGDADMKSIDLLSAGTEGAMKVEKTEVVKATVTEMPDFADLINKAVGSAMEKVIPTIVDKTTYAVMSGLLGEEGTRKALDVAKENVVAAKVDGIGDRNDASPMKKGLQLGIITTKATDTSTGNEPIPEPVNVDMEKVKAGDVNELIKFMKDVKVTDSVPNTLHQVLGALGKGR